MDIEFHYYMTYLIAARAGYHPAEAAIIAQAAQEVDDNHIPIEVNAGSTAAYKSTVSQTMQILHPRHDKKIYPVFHFIPGVPDAPSAQRKDGKQNKWVTTPDSPLANQMLQTALDSNDLYRIGASAHSYVDTWAHQNFLGIEDDFNDLPFESEGLEEQLMNMITPAKIGHALAGHQPDIPDLIWDDARLLNSTVINVDRFMSAAAALFKKLHAHRGAQTDMEHELKTLERDLRADIGPPSANSAPQIARIKRYKLRAMSPPYGATVLPEYLLGKWSDAAFDQKRTDLAVSLAIYMDEKAGIVGDVLDFGTSMPCTWINPNGFKETHWYKFQEAVRSHLTECWDLLVQQFPELATE